MRVEVRSGTGVSADVIVEVLTAARYKRVFGHLTAAELPEAFALEHPNAELRRWFASHPLYGTAHTYVLTKMWGLNTEVVLEELAALVVHGDVSFAAAEA